MKLHPNDPQTLRKSRTLWIQIPERYVFHKAYNVLLSKPIQNIFSIATLDRTILSFNDTVITKIRRKNRLAIAIRFYRPGNIVKPCY